MSGSHQATPPVHRGPDANPGTCGYDCGQAEGVAVDNVGKTLVGGRVGHLNWDYYQRLGSLLGQGGGAADR